MKENEDEEQKEQNKQNKQNEQNKQKQQNKQKKHNKQKKQNEQKQTRKQQKKPVRTEPKGTLTTNDHPVLTHRCAQLLIIPRMQLHQLHQDTFPLRTHGTTAVTTPPTTFTTFTTVTTFTTGTCFNGTAGGGSIEIHPEPVESEEAAAVTAQKHCRTKVPPKKREII